MRRVIPRLIAIGLGFMLLTSAYQRYSSSSVMVKAANAFLDSLTPEQRAKVVFKFDDDQRFDWHFIPKERKGLTIGEMQPYQRALAHALLAAGLSQRGYIKATSIMSLEDVLKQMEKDDGRKRNPEKYHFCIFGTPDDHGTWAFSVEGHHVSQNFTIVNGKAIGAPSFFGSNPAEVKEGPRKGLRVLGAEEDLGRAMLQTLSPDQKKVAVVDQTAYKDVLTMASRKAALQGQPSGLSAAKMNEKQFAALLALMEEYANNMPEDLRKLREDQIQKAGKNIYFAWAGGADKGQPHYYRVQAPAFLIEYDDTQNNANHIHSVWRDYTNDFGLDLLAAHYKQSPHGSH